MADVFGHITALVYQKKRHTQKSCKKSPKDAKSAKDAKEMQKDHEPRPVPHQIWWAQHREQAASSKQRTKPGSQCITHDDRFSRAQYDPAPLFRVPKGTRPGLNFEPGRAAGSEPCISNTQDLGRLSGKNGSAILPTSLPLASGERGVPTGITFDSNGNS